MRIKKQMLLHPNHKLFSNTLLGIVAFLFVFACSFIAPKMAEQVVPQANAENEIALYFQSGLGTEQSPFEIATTSQLRLLQSQATNYEATTNKYYFLASDLNFDGEVFDPIPYFNGHFDGYGFVINNLSQTDFIGGRAGLFGNVGPNGVICDLGVKDAIINITNDPGIEATAGILCGYNEGELTSCFTTGTLSIGSDIQNVKAGGIVGTTISSLTGVICQADVSVGDFSTNYVGGIVGDSFSCGNTYNVIGAYFVGSVMGYLEQCGGITGRLSSGYYGASSSSFFSSTPTADIGGTKLTKALVASAYYGNGIVSNCDSTVFGGYPLLDWMYDRYITNEPTIDASNFSGGDGTQGNPYQISTADQLVYLSTISETPKVTSLKYFDLMNDIDLEGIEWSSIKFFCGIFNGNGYYIKNMTQTSYTELYTGEKCAGLFGVIGSSGGVYGFGVVDAEITLPSTDYNAEKHVGILSGMSTASFTRVFATGEISVFETTSNVKAGGLVGSGNSTIWDSFSQASIHIPNLSSNFTGGIIGQADACSINYSYYVGEILGYTSQCGGIKGGPQVRNSVQNCNYYTQSEVNGLEGTRKTLLEIKQPLGTGFIFNPFDNIFGGFPLIGWMAERYSISDTIYSLFEGDGSLENPYQIETVHQFINLQVITNERDNGTSGRYFTLMNDLDLQGYTWQGMKYFGGILNGNGHVIFNLTSHSSGLIINGYDLDGWTGSFYCNIQNLGLVNLQITVDSEVTVSIGSFINNAYSDRSRSPIIINNCFVTGEIRVIGSQNGLKIGGFVGNATRNVKIDNCISQVSITVPDQPENIIGGFVGSISEGSSISEAYYTGCLSGNPEKTGAICGENLVGYNNGIFNILDCYYYTSSTGLNDYGTAKTEEEMKNFLPNPITFTGNSNAELLGGFPLLKWHATLNSIPIEPTILSSRFAGGNGTELNPYQISTPQHLFYLRDISRKEEITTNIHFILLNDINLEGYDWRSITFFDGVFDGNGNYITNLSQTKLDLTSDSCYAGFFGKITDNAEVFDLGIVDASIVLSSESAPAKKRVGLLAGENSGLVHNCLTTGQIDSPFNTYTDYCHFGGIVGYSFRAILNVFSIEQITTNNERTKIGGIAGYGEARYAYCIDALSSETFRFEGSYSYTISQERLKIFNPNRLEFSLNLDESVFGGYPLLNWVAKKHGLVSSFEMPVSSDGFSQGNGTEGTPYLISSVNELAYLQSFATSSSVTLGIHFKLATDLDISSYDWQPIEYFAGTFDGNHHKITGMTMVSEPDSDGYKGFFASLSGTVKNLGLEDMRLRISRGSVGGIAGNATGATITGCYTTGAIKSISASGAIMYRDSGSNISKCFGQVNMDYTGNGIRGYQDYNSSNIYNSYFVGNIQGANYIRSFSNTAAISDSSSEQLKRQEIQGFARNIDDQLFGGYPIFIWQHNVIYVPYIHVVTIAESISSETILGPFSVGDLVTLNVPIPSGYEIEKWTIKNYEETYEVLSNNLYNIYDNSLSYSFSVMDANSIVYLYLNRDASPIFSGGNGTVNYPYLIANSVDLKTLSSQATSISATQAKHYKLENDINMYAIDWTPIQVFAGTFDGNGKIISNIRIDSNNNENCGFFGQLNGATVSDLGLKDAYIQSTSTNLGILSGSAIDSTIERCFTTGQATCSDTSDKVGGIVGQADNQSQINSCFSQATLNGRTTSGIACGALSINNCYYIGTSTATQYAYGINDGNSLSISNSIHNSNCNGSITFETLHYYSFGTDFVTNVTDEYNGAPLLIWLAERFNTDKSIVILTASELQNLSLIETEGKTFVLGADIDLSGVEWSPITNFKGVLNGGGHVVSNLTINTSSGSAFKCYGLFEFLIGATIENLGIENYHITINNPNCSVGPLAGGVGLLGVTISNCYATGIISNTASSLTLIGGLVGYSSINSLASKLTNNYAILDYQNVGLALTNASALVNNMQGSSNYYKSNNLFLSDGASGVSLENLKQQATFENWDFDYIWEISENDVPSLIRQPIISDESGLIEISFEAKDTEDIALDAMLSTSKAYTNGNDIYALCTATFSGENVFFSGWYKDGTLVSRRQSIAVKRNQACTYTAVYVHDGLVVNYNNYVVTTNGLLCNKTLSLSRNDLNLSNSINDEITRVNLLYGTKHAYYTIFDTYNYLTTVGDIDNSLYGSIDIDIYYYAEHTITFDPGESAFTPPSMTVVYQDKIKLPLLTREYYFFDGWCTDLENIEDTTLAVDENGYHAVANLETDITVYAIWRIEKYDIIARVFEGQEAYGFSVGSGQYDHGSSATLVATANEHYRFVEWRKNNVFFANEASVLIEDIVQDEIFIAVFEKESYSVTLIYDNQKASATGAGQYEYGSSVTVEAVAVEGNIVGGWYSAGTLLSGNNQYTFVITENIELTLRVVTEVKHITINTADGQSSYGEVLADNNGDVYVGEDITIVAYPNNGYKFVCWKAVGSDEPLTTNSFYKLENVTTNQSFVAYFEVFSYDEYTATDEVEIIPQGDRYSISEAGHLVWLSSQVNSGTSFAGKEFVLINDITLEKHFVPIGDSFACSFDGVFDFAGYSIIDLKISNFLTNRELSVIGLFGYLKRATIKNANLKNIQFDICNKTSNTEIYVGGLAGIIDSYSSISYAVISGYINASCDNSFIGGLLGRNDGQINNMDCSVNISSSGQNAFVGGIVGEGSGSLEKAVSKGSLFVLGAENNESYAGGVIGYTAGITMRDVISANEMISGGINSIIGQFIGMCDAELLLNCSKLYTFEILRQVGNNNALGSMVYIQRLDWFIDDTVYFNSMNWDEGIWDMSKWRLGTNLLELSFCQDGLNVGTICIAIKSHASIKNMFVKIVIKNSTNEYVFWAKSGVRFMISDIPFGRYELYAYTLDSYEITTNFSAVELAESINTKLVEIEIYEHSGQGVLAGGIA